MNSRYRIEEIASWFVVVDTAYPKAPTSTYERARFTTKVEALQRVADLVLLDNEEG